MELPFGEYSSIFSYRPSCGLLLGDTTISDFAETKANQCPRFSRCKESRRDDCDDMIS